MPLDCSSLKDTGRLGEWYIWMKTGNVDVLGIEEAQVRKVEGTYKYFGVEVCSIVGVCCLFTAYQGLSWRIKTNSYRKEDFSI